MKLHVLNNTHDFLFIDSHWFSFWSSICSWHNWNCEHLPASFSSSTPQTVGDSSAPARKQNPSSVLRNGGKRRAAVACHGHGYCTCLPRATLGMSLGLVGSLGICDHTQLETQTKNHHRQNRPCFGVRREVHYSTTPPMDLKETTAQRSHGQPSKATNICNRVKMQQLMANNDKNSYRLYNALMTSDGFASSALVRSCNHVRPKSGHVILPPCKTQLGIQGWLRTPHAIWVKLCWSHIASFHLVWPPSDGYDISFAWEKPQ